MQQCQLPIEDSLTIYPESAINAQAAKAYEKLKNSKKIKLINKGKDLNNIIDIGDKISKSVSIFFQNQNLKDPTKQILPGSIF